ncbi:MAG: hypothetical protein BGO98_28675 [Myxococcales bacterium 68-20]|nr:MAG: hypothetical protein BGO98_28675 [Myxococcales bacterium 68-20]
MTLAPELVSRDHRGRMHPWIGLSLMLEDDFRLAAGPLFAEGVVDVLEWSFDTGWGRAIPEWADALLDHYGEAGRLLGHGVHYSAFSARWEERQARWLERLAGEVARRTYVHVSEHYGFMTAAPFMRGAPLPVPRGEASRSVGRDRLERMRAVLAAGRNDACPIGLENLALAWNRDEALAHGAFLGEVLDHAEDFIVLDVHNLHCQIENFDIDPDELLDSFPAARIRELHVSGGSFLPAWPHHPEETVRCDTHDGDVPAPVFDLLERALDRFPDVRAVILERLGGTLRTQADIDTFRRDYLRVKQIVDHSRDGEGARDGDG